MYNCRIKILFPERRNRNWSRFWKQKWIDPTVLTPISNRRKRWTGENFRLFTSYYRGKCDVPKISKKVVKTHPEIHHRSGFHYFEIEFWASLSYKEQESSRISVHSRFEEVEFVVRVLKRFTRIRSSNFLLSKNVFALNSNLNQIKVNCESWLLQRWDESL